MDFLLLDVVRNREINLVDCGYKKIEVPIMLKSPMIRVNGVTYAIGGGLPPFNRCFQVNTIDLESKRLDDLLEGRVKHGVVYMNSEIYVVGGIGMTGNASGYLNSVEKYDFKTWQTVKPMNYQRIQPSACAWKNCIYVVGGDSDLKSIEKFKNNTWEVLAFKLPVGLRKVGLACVNNEIIITGGNLMAFRTIANSRKALKINCLSDQVEEIADMPLADCFENIGKVLGHKLVFIGENAKSTYNLKKNTWKSEEFQAICPICSSSTDSEICEDTAKYLFYKTYRLLKPGSRLV